MTVRSHLALALRNCTDFLLFGTIFVFLEVLLVLFLMCFTFFFFLKLDSCFRVLVCSIFNYARFPTVTLGDVFSQVLRGLLLLCLLSVVGVMGVFFSRSLCDLECEFILRRESQTARQGPSGTLMRFLAWGPLSRGFLAEGSQTTDLLEGPACGARCSGKTFSSKSQKRCDSAGQTCSGLSFHGGGPLGGSVSSPCCVQVDSR